MKRTKLILAVIGLALLLAASSEAGPLFGGTSRVVDIYFVGFSDGLHMTINYNTGKVVATQTGSVSEAEWGTVGALLDGSYKGGAVTLMCLNTAFGTPFYAVIMDNPMIWIYYKAGGVRLNSGTYAVGAPAADAQGAGLGPSTAPK
jgi:hypothetical protein